MKHNTLPHGRRSRQEGIALIEALVGLLIFSFGVIGLVGLQVAMTRAQGNAKFRADAVYLSSQVVGSMWTDRGNIGQYDSASCSGYAPCKVWTDKVASTLPAGSAQLSITPASGAVSVTVTWSTTAEGTHSHVVTTSVN
ncbi:MAG: pilus assembly protein PilV [Ramlibacter sp.]|nr:pilus assembly protein PilV [Ramlibacter sp.]